MWWERTKEPERPARECPHHHCPSTKERGDGHESHFLNQSLFLLRAGDWRARPGRVLFRQSHRKISKWRNSNLIVFKNLITYQKEKHEGSAHVPQKEIREREICLWAWRPCAWSPRLRLEFALILQTFKQLSNLDADAVHEGRGNSSSHLHPTPINWTLIPGKIYD